MRFGLFLGLLLLTACDVTSPSDPVPLRPGPAEPLTPEQKRRTDALVNLFEYGTQETQYARVEALGDGRGYTAGKVGFTTGTGDALLVAARYTQARPANPLARFLPELRRLARSFNPGSVRGLAGFDAAWAEAALDDAFRAAQDSVADSLYYRPALVRAYAAGAHSALARAALYDAIVQHGEGTDPDGLPALLVRTASRAGGTPAGGTDERAWLRAFLHVRRATLEWASNPATREGWRESTGRVTVWETLEAAGNVALDGPIRLQTDDYDEVIE